LNIRVIPRLDIKGPNLVKGIHFEGLRVLGKPEDFARYYYENGADELYYVDAVASLYGRNSLLDIVERTASEIFIPLAVGGGLRSVDDIKTVLRAGADKVTLNTAAIERPELVREASRKFGSSTIVVSIEAVKKRDGSYEAFTNYGRESTGVNALEWAKRAVELGAGELMVTSISQEGTGKGYDLELIRQISESVPVPVIPSGGAGPTEHVAGAVATGQADAVSMASILHYDCVGRVQYDAQDFPGEGNVEFLQKGRWSSRILGVSIQQVKSHLMDNGIPCRPNETNPTHV